MRRVSSWSTVGAMLLVARSVCAQGGDGYDLLRSAIDGGGGTSAAGTYRIDATIGQPDAGTQNGGSYILRGGFWGGIAGGAASPTATPSPSASRSATPSPSPIATPTRTPTGSVITTSTPTSASTAVPSASFTPTRTHTSTVVASVTPTPPTTPVPTATATATVSPGSALGDANCDGVVSVADIPNVIARSASPQSPLCGADTNGDLVVDSNDLPALIERLFGE
jgi:hypothetical protein